MKAKNYYIAVVILNIFITQNIYSDNDKINIGFAYKSESYYKDNNYIESIVDKLNFFDDFNIKTLIQNKDNLDKNIYEIRDGFVNYLPEYIVLIDLKTNQSYSKLIVRIFNLKNINKISFYREYDIELGSTAKDISSDIYRSIKNKISPNESKLAYIEKTKNSYEIKISNLDMTSSEIIYTSNQAITSLKWSRDNSKLLFIKNDSIYSYIYLYDLSTKLISEIIKNKYIVSNLEFGHKLNTLIFSCINNGMPMLYMVNLSNNEYQKITKNNYFESSPYVINNNLYFISKRDSETFQIYRIKDIEDDNIEIISLENFSQHSSPVVNNSEDKLIYLKYHNVEGNKIVLYNLRTNTITNLVDNIYLISSMQFVSLKEVIVFSEVFKNINYLSFLNINNKKIKRLIVKDNTIIEIAIQSNLI